MLLLDFWDLKGKINYRVYYINGWRWVD